MDDQPTVDTGPGGGEPFKKVRAQDSLASTSSHAGAAPGGGGDHSQSPTAGAAGVGGALLAPKSKFGRYTIVRLIGHGGMGAVYEAQQDSPRRSVALKVIRSSYVSAQMLRRFEHESQVLGRLQHPGIAQVYEAGSVQDAHAEGGGTVPFFAMELIKGVPLTEYAAAKTLGTRERLEMVARICDAVYHAHQKGVIHRDLKPANILVDESGQPKILDFGVARATDSDIQQTTMQTDIGQLIGTVPYMSPEQVGGDPDALDTRSDVYALGVIAYELLAGRLPYDLQKKMIHEAVRVIREDEPTRLSSINRTLRGDVETIVGHALEKDKTRRYQSADALGTDIRRYLKDEPIAARPASTWYQAAKFARRNKVLVGGVAATFVALVAGIIGVSLSLNRALTAESDLTDQIGETTTALAAATKAEGEATTARNEAIRERDAAEYEAYVAQLTAADASLLTDQPARARESLDACPAQLRGWEWRYLNAMSDTSAATVTIGPQSAGAVDLSPDGSRFAYTHGHASVGVRDAATTQEVNSFVVGQTALKGVAFSPDGSRLLVIGLFNELFLYDPLTGQRLLQFKTGGIQHYEAQFSPDGARIAVGFKDGCARLLDCLSGEELVRFGGHDREVVQLAFSPDGQRLITGSRDGRLALWQVDGKLIAELDKAHEEILCVAFSPDGKLVLSGARGDNNARLWNGSTGELVAVLPMRDALVAACTFSPDSSLCATGSQTGAVIVWETAKGAEVARMTGHRESIRDIRFGGNGGARLLTASSDKTARIWETRTGLQLSVLRGHTGGVASARYAPGGGTVLTFSFDGTIKLWRLTRATGAAILGGHKHVVLDAVFSRDGSRIATASLDDTAKVWNSETGECVFTYTHDQNLANVSFSPDSSRILLCPSIGPPFLVDIQSGNKLRSYGADGSRFLTARLSPDGSRVLAVETQSGATVFDAETGAALFTFKAPIGTLQTAAYSPNQQRIATISSDGAVRLWNAADGSELPTPMSPVSAGRCLTYSPDGSTIAVGSLDGWIELRSAEDGQILSRRLAHDERVVGIRYSPDGTRIVTASWDYTARIWDSRTLRMLSTIRAHTVWVNAACFSPDGERILTAASDATARIHDSVPVSLRWPIGKPAAPK